MARLLDISPLVSERLPVWPGDTPYRRTVHASFENGDRALLSSIETTLHAGAHADAPGHTLWGAGSIDQQPLVAYYGACQVVKVSVPEGGRVGPDDLGGEVAAPRLLIRTDSFPAGRFGTRFAGLSPGLAASTRPPSTRSTTRGWRATSRSRSTGSRRWRGSSCGTFRPASTP